MSMRPETRQSMEMLFSAKWNLPKAAKNCNLTDKEMKITFNEYCRLNPPTWEEWYIARVAESVDAPDLKSVVLKETWGFKSPLSHADK